MSKHLVPGQPIDHGDGDEPMSNPSHARHFQEILEARMNRRMVLKGSLSAAVAGLFGTAALQGCGSGSSSGSGAGGGSGSVSPQLLGFDSIPISENDDVRVPAGYSTQVIAEWGRSISNPGILYDLPLTGAQQGDAVGSHHDGMHFFPIEGADPYEGSSVDGLLVMNHEYVEPRYMHASAIGQALSRSAFPTYEDNGETRRVADEVLTEMNGHGVSVVRVQQQVPPRVAICWTPERSMSRSSTTTAPASGCRSHGVRVCCSRSRSIRVKSPTAPASRVRPTCLSIPGSRPTGSGRPRWAARNGALSIPTPARSTSH